MYSIVSYSTKLANLSSNAVAPSQPCERSGAISSNKWKETQRGKHFFSEPFQGSEERQHNFKNSVAFPMKFLVLREEEATSSSSMSFLGNSGWWCWSLSVPLGWSPPSPWECAVSRICQNTFAGKASAFLISFPVLLCRDFKLLASRLSFYRPFPVNRTVWSAQFLGDHKSWDYRNKSEKRINEDWSHKSEHSCSSWGFRPFIALTC